MFSCEFCKTFKNTFLQNTSGGSFSKCSFFFLWFKSKASTDVHVSSEILRSYDNKMVVYARDTNVSISVIDRKLLSVVVAESSKIEKKDCRQTN